MRQLETHWPRTSTDDKERKNVKAKTKKITLDGKAAS